MTTFKQSIASLMLMITVGFAPQSAISSSSAEAFPNYLTVIEKHATEFNLTYPHIQIIQAIMKVESNGISTSVGEYAKTSCGVMQLLPSTASAVVRIYPTQFQDLPKKITCKFLVTNPDHNIRLAVAYYKYNLLQLMNNPVKTIFAYNAGDGAAKKLTTKQAQNSTYVKTVVKHLNFELK